MEIAQRADTPPRLERVGYTTPDPFVHLGRFPSTRIGAHEIRVRIERVPAGLQGEHADLVVDSDMLAYKSARGRSEVRTMAHVLLGFSAAATLLLGLLALHMRPRVVGTAREGPTAVA